MILKERPFYTVMFFSVWRNSPTRARAASSLKFLDHTHDTPQSVGLLWTSDRLVAETST